MDPWVLTGHQPDVEPLIPEEIFPLWLIAVAGESVLLTALKAAAGTSVD